jgi:mannosyltransferase
MSVGSQERGVEQGEDPPSARPRRPVGAAVFGLAVFGVAMGVGLYRIGRAAYWVDEATTVMLVRWSWADLIEVIRGPEAPLGPFYLLLRPWTSLSAIEWWVRLPSALALAGAVALTGMWARRRLGTASALAGVGLTLALPVYSRYAQEARPYGLMVLAAALSAVAWWRWCERGGRLPAVGYALSVAILPLCHTLALTLVPAQVIAACVGATPDRAPGSEGPGLSRFGLAVRTAGLATLGLVPLLPYVWLVHEQAMGVAYPLPLTWSNAWTTFAASLAGPPRAAWLTDRLGAAVVVLAGVGLCGGLVLPGGRLRRAVLGFLACWAVVPPVLLSLAAISQETLVPRYFLVGLPGWGLLAGQGCVVVGRAVGVVLGAGGFPRGPARALSVVGGALPLVVTAWAGLPHQAHYRTLSGHDNGDVRPAIALLKTPPYRNVPVVMPSEQFWWIILAEAYDPSLLPRSPLAVGPAPGPDRHIVLHEVDAGMAAQRLTGLRRVAVLVRGDGPDTAGQARGAFPILSTYGVAEVSTFDGWSVVLLVRQPGGA